MGDVIQGQVDDASASSTGGIDVIDTPVRFGFATLDAVYDSLGAVAKSEGALHSLRTEVLERPRVARWVSYSRTDVNGDEPGLRVALNDVPGRAIRQQLPDEVAGVPVTYSVRDSQVSFDRKGKVTYADVLEEIRNDVRSRLAATENLTMGLSWASLTAAVMVIDAPPSTQTLLVLGVGGLFAVESFMQLREQREVLAGVDATLGEIQAEQRTDAVA